jgi:hypothetical protein
MYTQVGQFLVAAVHLICPPDTPHQRLMDDDALAETACRLSEAMGDFALNNHLAAVNRDMQLQLLLNLAAYLGSEYVPLASSTLPSWRRLVQGHERAVNRPPGAPSPLRAREYSGSGQFCTDLLCLAWRARATYHRCSCLRSGPSYVLSLTIYYGSWLCRKLCS